METHESDPTAETEADPWDTVSSEFSDLRARLTATYRQVADDRGPSEDNVKDAFSTLAEAWSQVATSVTSALKDPDVRDQLKKAASSFAAALGTTISDLGTELKEEHSEEE